MFLTSLREREARGDLRTKHLHRGNIYIYIRMQRYKYIYSCIHLADTFSLAICMCNSNAKIQEEWFERGCQVFVSVGGICLGMSLCWCITYSDFRCNTCSMVVMPARANSSLYWDSFMDSSHSSTDLKGAPPAPLVLGRRIDTLRDKMRSGLLSEVPTWI